MIDNRTKVLVFNKITVLGIIIVNATNKYLFTRRIINYYPTQGGTADVLLNELQEINISEKLLYREGGNFKLFIHFL